MKAKVTSALYALDFEEPLVAEILSIGRAKKAPAGNVLMSPDNPGTEVPFVLDGLLKVIRQESNGKEVFLYYLEGGETCAMSISCCLEGKMAAIKLVAEQDSNLWMIPMTFMDTWVVKYRSFRKFVFQSYQARFDELLYTIDNVVFHKMDERLYRYLLDTKQATGSFEIHTTHEQIAKALNTSRVVISRLLKQLEKEEKIEQHRNLIEVL